MAPVTKKNPPSSTSPGVRPSGETPRGELRSSTSSAPSAPSETFKAPSPPDFAALNKRFEKQLRTLDKSFWHCLYGLYCVQEFIDLLWSWLNLPDSSRKAEAELKQDVRGLAGGRLGLEFKGNLPAVSLLEMLKALSPTERKNLVLLLVALECAKPPNKDGTTSAPMDFTETPLPPTKDVLCGLNSSVALLDAHSSRNLRMEVIDTFDECVGAYIRAFEECQRKGVPSLGKASPVPWMVKLAGLWNAVIIDIACRIYRHEGLQIVMVISSLTAQRGLKIVGPNDSSRNSLLSKAADLIFALFRLLAPLNILDDKISYLNVLEAFYLAFEPTKLAYEEVPPFFLRISTELARRKHWIEAGRSPMVVLQVVLEGIAKNIRD